MNLELQSDSSVESSSEQNESTSPTAQLNEGGISAMQGVGDDSIESDQEQHSFVDGEGRSLEISRHESERSLQLNVHDPQGRPEAGNYGIARAHATLEPSYDPDQSAKVRLNDIVVEEAYRNAGISNEMLNEVEQFARERDASEIYGAITEKEAQAYWEHQAQAGWQITSHENGTQTASKSLS